MPRSPVDRGDLDGLLSERRATALHEAAEGNPFAPELCEARLPCGVRTDFRATSEGIHAACLRGTLEDAVAAERASLRSVIAGHGQDPPSPGGR